MPRSPLLVTSLKILLASDMFTGIIMVIVIAFVLLAAVCFIMSERINVQKERIDMLGKAIAKLVLRVSGERNWKDYI